MLEYYTMDANYMDSLELTEELFRFLLDGKQKQDPGNTEVLSATFIRITMEEAFRRWAGFDLYSAAVSQGAMETEARRLGLNPPAGLTVSELYDLIFIHTVEPQLKLERPVALIDYPAFVPCLAKKSPNGKTVERWELYSGGIELANCFSEETSAEEVRSFFESEKTIKEKTALVRHKTDDGYWKMFNPKDTNTPEKTISLKNDFPHGKYFPPCSGVAMGLDRLIMLLCNRKTIDGILPFPME
jgi:lysyl-tRNA synthetase class 2